MDKFLSLASTEERNERVPAADPGAATVAHVELVELGLATCRLWRRAAPINLCEELLTWAKSRPAELQQRPVVVAGRECMQNRITGIFAESNDLEYGYSGIKTAPTVGLTLAMVRAKALVEHLTGETVGAFRDFDVHPIAAPANGGHRKRIVRLPLGKGDVLYMPSAMQKHYKHSITRKAPEESGVRLSLTFRRVAKRT